MNRFVATLVLPALLLACGGGSNPFDPDPPTTVIPTDPTTGEPTETALGIPVSLAGDLTRLNYNEANQTLTVEGLTLDEVPFLASYRRRPAYDRNGYLAFTAQDDPLDRHYTAFAREAGNNSGVRGGVVHSGGPRNRFFAGGFYERDGDYTPPAVTATTGQVSYSGSYVGLINSDFRDDDANSLDDLADIPAGTSLVLIPGQAGIVEGQVFINADFADGSVEGNIFNRTLINPSTGNVATRTIVDPNSPDPNNPDFIQVPVEMPDLVLISTPIDNDGTFLGDVEYDQRGQTEAVTGTDIGDYGGIFGGTNASGVAGVVQLDEWDGPNNPQGIENELEHGIFVLDQCGQPVEDTAGCAGTNP